MLKFPAGKRVAPLPAQYRLPAPKPLLEVSMPARITDFREYYESNIIRIPLAGCWLWCGFTDNSGYGRTSSLHARHSHIHRLAWELFVGEIPNGLCVLHKCDNPLCSNPHHLFLGTRRDNNADRRRKGREGNRTGPRNGRTVLTELQVRSIYFDQRRICDIARNYGVSWTTIYQIKKRQNWSHLDLSASRI